MKPIEPGCLAVVVRTNLDNYENVGKVVRVGKFLGNNYKTFKGRIWSVDIPLRVHHRWSSGEVTVAYERLAHEHNLMRIDDGEFDKEQDEQIELEEVNEK